MHNKLNTVYSEFHVTGKLQKIYDKLVSVGFVGEFNPEGTSQLKSGDYTVELKPRNLPRGQKAVAEYVLLLGYHQRNYNRTAFDRHLWFLNMVYNLVTDKA